jgi:hypothetical protein
MTDLTPFEYEDTRPVVEPAFFSYCELPDDPDKARALFIDMADSQKANGAVSWRFTTFSPEYPSPIYPDGLYVEGWKDLPDGPWRAAPFNFPLYRKRTA